MDLLQSNEYKFNAEIVYVITKLSERRENDWQTRNEFVSPLCHLNEKPIVPRANRLFMGSELQEDESSIGHSPEKQTFC